MLGRPVTLAHHFSGCGATSSMAESLPQVNSGRFSVLDEDLGDTEVDLHAESNVESIPVDSENDAASHPGNATLDQSASIPVEEPLGSWLFSVQRLVQR